MKIRKYQPKDGSSAHFIVKTENETFKYGINNNGEIAAELMAQWSLENGKRTENWYEIYDEYAIMYIYDKNNEVVSRSKYAIRFLLFALTIYGSLIFYGIPLLGSVLCMSLTKNGASLHDLVVQTSIVDTLVNNNPETLDKRDVIEVTAEEKKED